MPQTAICVMLWLLLLKRTVSISISFVFFFSCALIFLGISSHSVATTTAPEKDVCFCPLIQFRFEMRFAMRTMDRWYCAVVKSIAAHFRCRFSFVFACWFFCWWKIRTAVIRLWFWMLLCLCVVSFDFHFVVWQFSSKFLSFMRCELKAILR